MVKNGHLPQMSLCDFSKSPVPAGKRWLYQELQQVGSWTRVLLVAGLCCWAQEEMWEKNIRLDKRKKFLLK